MKDRDLIYLGAAMIYSAMLIRGEQASTETKTIAISKAADLFGNVPYGTVDGKRYYESAKEDIIRRKSNGKDLVKDL